MLSLGKQFKPMMLCFSIVAFLLIGYAVSGGPLHEAAKKGRTPLDLAIYSHHKDVAELLIKHGGEPRSPWSGAASGRLLFMKDSTAFRASCLASFSSM